MIERRIWTTSFLHGFTAPLRILDRTERPGSYSKEMIELTTPENLADYNIESRIPAFLIELKEKEIERDAIYSSTVRIAGYIGLLAMIAAVVFLRYQ